MTRKKLTTPRSARRRAGCTPMLLLALLVTAPFASAQDDAAPRGVTAARLGTLLVDRTFTAPAAVVPANESALAAEVPGVVTAIEYDVGASVGQGDLLVAIDDRDHVLAVRRAEAQLAAAEARIRQADLRLERARSLSGDGFISDDDLLARQTDLDVAKADRAIAEVTLAEGRRSLEKTTVRAPFAGTIVARAAQVGAYVAPGMPLMTLVEDGMLEIEAELDPGYAEFLLTAPEIRLRVRDREAPVALARLSRVIDPATRVQLARLTFLFEPEFPAGSTGTLTWIGARGQLPAGLVIRRGDAYGVFVAEGEGTDQRARFIELPNAQEGRPVAVGLAEDTLIVTTGADRLQDGDPVLVGR